MVFNRASRYAKFASEPIEKIAGYSQLQLLIAVVLLMVTMAFLVIFLSRLLSDAERIQVQATAISLRAAVLGAHEAWIAKGHPSQLAGVYGDDIVLQMSPAGWPLTVSRQQSGGHYETTADALEACQALWAVLLIDNAVRSVQQTGQNRYRVQAVADQCWYQFTDPHGRLDGTAIIEYSMTTGHVNFNIR